MSEESLKEFMMWLRENRCWLFDIYDKEHFERVITTYIDDFIKEKEESMKKKIVNF